jgi:hypothetical protein
MTDTANLGLPCIQGSQAQKHVTHNEALRILDTLVQLAVDDRDLTAPPGTPSEGARYIVKTGATGAWAGRDDEIAAWQDGAWQFNAPRAGWLAYVIDEGALLAWSGSAWVDAIAALTSLNNMALLGICTTADTTNPFSAKLNNALFVSRTVAEGGDGDLRTKMSKESSSNTASLLFQDNYSGRAEFGLTGDDDFHVKVSADGTTWHEAIVIDRTNGQVSFPQGGAGTDLELTLAQLTLGVADALNTAQFLGSSGNRVADSFDTLTCVDSGAATNLDSGSVGVLKPTQSGGVDLSASAQAISGGDSSGGMRPKGNAFDNDTGTRWGSSQIDTAVSGAAYIGQDFGSGQAKHIRTITIRQRQDTASAQVASVKVQFSDDGSAWTDEGTHALTKVASAGTLTLHLSATGAHRYWRILANANPAPSGGWEWQVDEITMAEAAAVNNLSVTSVSFPAAGPPAAAKLVARIKEIDALTLNTDLVFSGSRDGGVTWTAFTMTRKFTATAIAVCESDQISLSAQPSGTAMKWKAASANGKSFELHDVYLFWS